MRSDAAQPKAAPTKPVDAAVAGVAGGDTAAAANGGAAGEAQQAAAAATAAAAGKEKTAAAGGSSSSSSGHSIELKERFFAGATGELAPAWQPASMAGLGCASLAAPAAWQFGTSPRPPRATATWRYQPPASFSPLPGLAVGKSLPVVWKPGRLSKPFLVLICFPSYDSRTLPCIVCLMLLPPTLPSCRSPAACCRAV